MTGASLALHHIRAAERLLPRYGALGDVASHLAAARAALERETRSEDITREVDVPTKR